MFRAVFFFNFIFWLEKNAWMSVRKYVPWKVWNDAPPSLYTHIKALPLTRHRCSQRHEHHSRHRVLQPYRAAEVGRQITGDRRQDADKRYGDNEAGPAVPVLCGRHEGEQNLPEHGEEVHDVVEAGRQPLLAALLLVVVSFGRSGWFECWGKRQIGRGRAER